MKFTRSFFVSLAGASLLLIILASINRILGFLREIIYASEFGISKDFDIFLVVSILPITINTVIYYIAQNYFIPNYSYYKSNKTEADEFLINNYIGFAIIGLLIFVTFFMFSEKILFIMLGLESLSNSTIITFNIFLLTIPISSISSLIAAYLNYSKKFPIPALAAVFQNISVVLIVIFTNKLIGIISISVGYLVGTILQLFYLHYKSKIKFNSYFLKNISFKYWLRKSSQSLIIIIAIESISQLYIISDRFFFSYVNVGGLSALNYAQNIALLPVTIISLSINTILFPKFSENISNIKTDQDSLFIKSISLTLFIFIPIFIAFTFWSQEVITLIYERGKFIKSDSLNAARLLTYFGYGILFYSIYALLNKIIYSARLYKILLLITVIGILTKILFNFLLVIPFNYFGLAISTSLSYLVFFILSYLFLKPVLGVDWIFKSLKELLHLLLNAIMSFLIVETIFQVDNVFNSKFQFLMKILIYLFVFIFNYSLSRYGLKEFLLKHSNFKAN